MMLKSPTTPGRKAGPLLQGLNAKPDLVEWNNEKLFLYLSSLLEKTTTKKECFQTAACSTVAGFIFLGCQFVSREGKVSILKHSL